MATIEEVFVESIWHDDLDQAKAARDTRAAELSAQGLECTCETLYRINDGYRVYVVTAKDPEPIEEFSSVPKKRIPSPGPRGERGDRPERGNRAERGNRLDRADRRDRPERGERGDRPVDPQRGKRHLRNVELR